MAYGGGGNILSDILDRSISTDRPAPTARAERKRLILRLNSLSIDVVEKTLETLGQLGSTKAIKAILEKIGDDAEIDHLRIKACKSLATAFKNSRPEEISGVAPRLERILAELDFQKEIRDAIQAALAVLRS